MGRNDYQSGFVVGQTGGVGKPPYDPRDPLTMKFVNEFNRGYDDGYSARLRAVTRPSSKTMPEVPRR